ncbi:hypothetical protein VTN77DRAFT_4416 [Rasamsonia byssochlamydoides]|uniref:uncharacterized protein n=1 Tax=Rasamsonia byssochlamydoides TaxID=89139 RepID=UPI003744039F
MMTTHQTGPVVLSNRFDNGQYRQQNGDNIPQQPDLPEVPPSPTLTNPDMILPYEGERQSSTPSPPFRLPSLSDMQLLHGGQQLSGNYQSGFNHGGEISNTQIGVAVSTPNRPPRSKWTYEGHAPGRPLSDIGEEDSQSSPPGSRGSDWNPRADYGQGRNAEESETCSSGSSSTISARSHRGRWDRHESRSLEGKRDGSNEDHIVQDSVEATRAQTGAALLYEGSHDEDSSSAILSSEAERILENAKRRLTLMEGNLTRARSSIRLTPSPSPTGSLLPRPQPVGELYRSIAQTDRRSSILRPRPIYNVTQDAGSNSHSRVYSETHLPSTRNSGPRASESLQTSRSLSALGSTSASSYEADDGSFRYNSSRSLTARPSSAFYHPTLNSLREDDGRKSRPRASSPKTSSRLGISTSRQVPKITTMEEFNSVYPSEGPPSRAQSQLQVRDLRDQAEGLKTKISMLKLKTQEDNLRRRSLQSLRTPSPFTDAERWFTSSMEYRESSSTPNSNSGHGWSPKEQKEESSSQTREDEQPTDQPSPEKSLAHETARESGDDNDDFNSVVESHYEDAEEGEYYNEGDGSSGSEIDHYAPNGILNEPLDDEDDEVYEDLPPESTPHEEREDAFDYENFYLHSALGTFTQAKLRRSSYSSTASVETTRPFPSSTDNSQPGAFSRHSRTNSSDSVSTAATFATATEGAYGSDDEQNAEDEIDRALNWPQVPRNGVYSQQQNRRTTNGSRVGQMRNLTVNSMKTTGILTPPGSAVRETSGSVTQVSTFLSSLGPGNPSSRSSSGLNNDDTQLLEQVFQSLGKVCTELQELTAPGVDADPKTIRTLRRRLDAARRVLDGQLDA